MTKLYTTNDISPEALADAKIAVLGYGSQGRAQALNLRDSGFHVVLGLRENGPSCEQARADGWEPESVTVAVKDADVVAVLVPDPAQPVLFEKEVAPHLKEGALLLFAHGFNVHFDQLKLPTGVDVGLVAPKAPGDLVRRQYNQELGVPCLVAVHQDATTTALDRTLAYAQGLGAARAAILETTFGEETETDLFGEQAVLCGGVTELVTAGWEVLVEAGYSPSVAYFECLHELKLIVDLIYEGGFGRMHQFVSTTASFGDLTRGQRVIDRSVRDRMRAVLKEIQNGEFAREWSEENQSGGARYRDLLKADLTHPIEAVGADLRSRMPWLSQGGTP